MLFSRSDVNCFDFTDEGCCIKHALSSHFTPENILKVDYLLKCLFFLVVTFNLISFIPLCRNFISSNKMKNNKYHTIDCSGRVNSSCSISGTRCVAV